jgi:hypothetical protein
MGGLFWVQIVLCRYQLIFHCASCTMKARGAFLYAARVHCKVYVNPTTQPREHSTPIYLLVTELSRGTFDKPREGRGDALTAKDSFTPYSQNPPAGPQLPASIQGNKVRATLAGGGAGRGRSAKVPPPPWKYPCRPTELDPSVALKGRFGRDTASYSPERRGRQRIYLYMHTVKPATRRGILPHGRVNCTQAQRYCR